MMQNAHYDTFISYLEKEDKNQAVQYALSLLEQKILTIEALYEDILAPSSHFFACKLKDQAICIWKEHTRTSIIRTILEATYPYIIERTSAVNKRNRKVVVVCPQEEYHEIGAIMATHYFILAGFDAQYIGANTPKEEIISATRVLKPDYLALSVTNYYNLFTTKKIVEEVKRDYPHVTIIIGGQAFSQKGATEQIPFDIHLEHMKDIFTLESGVTQ
jgi:methanogenic corrinoid protein MtbC1